LQDKLQSRGADSFPGLGDVRKGFSRQRGELEKFQALLGSPGLLKRQAGINLDLARAKQDAETGLKAETNNLKFGGTLGPLVTGLGKLGPYAAVAAVALAGVGIALKGVEKVANVVIGLAAKASPMAFERFQLAVDDTQAIIGRVFVPVLEQATQGVRLVADVLASVLPTQQEMRAVMRELDPVFKSLRESATEIAPIIRDVAVVHLKAAAIALKVFADHIQMVIKAAKVASGKSLLDALREKLFGKKDDPELASSYGASQFGGVRFSGAEEFSKSVSAAVLQQMNPAASLPAKVDQSNKLLGDILNGILLLAPGPAGDVSRAVRSILGG